MDHHSIIRELTRHKDVFKSLLSGVGKELQTWRPAEGKWCLLEVVCHLRDEEKEDFRERTKRVLEGVEGPLPGIDPVAWVTERSYLTQDYDKVLQEFLNERERSIHWLNELQTPQWRNEYLHPKIGPMSAELFLSNWLAHDYLHIRQIIRMRFAYLEQNAGLDLAYAGVW